MLVITRREFEYIMINDNIKIRVERVRQGEVRLSFDAPLSEKIWRGELYERRKREAEEAAMRREKLETSLIPEAGQPAAV